MNFTLNTGMDGMLENCSRPPEHLWSQSHELSIRACSSSNL